MKEALSLQRFVDAGGTYLEIASSTGLSIEHSEQKVAYPEYAKAAITLGVDPMTPQIALSKTDITVRKEALRKLGGLRVIAAIATRNRNAFVPAVLLQDGAATPRVGCLLSRYDVRETNTHDAIAPLSDLQQILLAKIVAEHQPEVARHDNGAVNGAEIGHAVLAAAAVTPYGIHRAVHEFADSGVFSAKVAKSGATDLQTKSGIRINREGVFDITELAGLIIVSDHQSPWPLDDSFDVSVGFTHAAVQSNSERPQPDLQANLQHLLEAV